MIPIIDLIKTTRCFHKGFFLSLSLFSRSPFAPLFLMMFVMLIVLNTNQNIDEYKEDVV